MYFPKYHDAALLFLGVNKISSHLITGYYGFAILGYNVQNASLSLTHIHFFEHHIAEMQRNHTIGSGIHFLYEHNLHHISHAEIMVTIKKCFI